MPDDKVTPPAEWWAKMAEIHRRRAAELGYPRAGGDDRGNCENPGQ